MPGTELFGNEEKKEIQDVLETGILFRYNHDAARKGHWKTKDFESEVKKVTGAPFAHAVCNGTAAITAALAASGIGMGDEVIVPPFTFIATIEAVLFIGAIPVFAEIDDTLCLSAEGIRKVATAKTKAVCLVHMCGGMADMDSIMKVIHEKNLILVEDAGQSFGSSYKGKYTGLFGKAGSYSFDFFKIATAGEGGVLVTHSEEIYKKADVYTDHGHNHEGSFRGMEKHPYIGFNFRISELHAAIGLAQTRRVPAILKENRRKKVFMRNLLSSSPEISFVRVPDPSGDSATFLNLLLPTPKMAEEVVAEMKASGVAGFDYWFKNMYHFINQWDHITGLRSISKMVAHSAALPQDYAKLDLKISQDVIGRLISFTIRNNWSDDDMKQLCEGIAKSVKKVNANAIA